MTLNIPIFWDVTRLGYTYHTKPRHIPQDRNLLCHFRVNLIIRMSVPTKQYQTEITNRFAALENSDDEEDVNRTWENIKENIQTSAKESLVLDEFKQNKQWFDEEYLGFLDQRKRAKIQWIQDPS